MKPPPVNEIPIGGAHYAALSVQPWDAMESWLSREQFLGFCIGNAIKYLARFNATEPGKGGVQDLKKARHYIQKVIAVASNE